MLQQMAVLNICESFLNKLTSYYLAKSKILVKNFQKCLVKNTCKQLLVCKQYSNKVQVLNWNVFFISNQDPTLQYSTFFKNMSPTYMLGCTESFGWLKLAVVENFYQNSLQTFPYFQVHGIIDILGPRIIHWSQFA